MNISEITRNPVHVFKESFDYSEKPSLYKWEQKLSKAMELCSKVDFTSGPELLTLIEQTTGTIFSSCENHPITNLNRENSNCSELLGSFLMSLTWLNNKKTFPKVITMSQKYFFMCPNGEVMQVNSNKKNPLSNSEKYDLFSSDHSTQFQFVDLLKHYFEEICAQYIKTQNFEALKKAQTYMIQLDPRDTKWYARRGLLLKQLGEFSNALSDLKRFVSFHSYEDAPQAVQNALIELEGLNAIDNFSEYLVH